MLPKGVFAKNNLSDFEESGLWIEENILPKILSGFRWSKIEIPLPKGSVSLIWGGREESL